FCTCSGNACLLLNLPPRSLPPTPARNLMLSCPTLHARPRSPQNPATCTCLGSVQSPSRRPCGDPNTKLCESYPLLPFPSPHVTKLPLKY
uniref:Uncharacterized protein n=1 Tax=Crocodylus porosus TaxID=8502 RepID=A0A7M4G2M7_CROPO